MIHSHCHCEGRPLTRSNLIDCRNLLDCRNLFTGYCIELLRKWLFASPPRVGGIRIHTLILSYRSSRRFSRHSFSVFPHAETFQKAFWDTPYHIASFSWKLIVVFHFSGFFGKIPSGYLILISVLCPIVHSLIL